MPGATAAVAAEGYLAGYLKTDPFQNFGAAVAYMGEAYVPVTEGEQEAAELPGHAESGAAGADDTLTPEADALAARAAQLRRTGSTSGGVL